MTRSEDKTSTGLLSGYRLPYDPRPAIAKLKAGQDGLAWAELWDELHHQGDVDTASYAAVPELVRVHEARTVPDWNMYALVGTIELERGRGKNPDLPSWVEQPYRAALTRLGELAHEDLKATDDPLIARSALGVIALTKGLREHARLLFDLGESEVKEIVDEYWGGA
jgi:hypothetical protein